MRSCLICIALMISSLLAASDLSANDIHEAARTGDLERLWSILDSDPSQIDTVDTIGHTALSLSAVYGHWDMFRYLIATGADVNHTARSGETPLHCVCQHDLPEMANVLLANGAAASLEAKDVFGDYTPVLRAVQRGNGEIARYLIANGADPRAITKEGWTALHLAAKCGHRDLYKMLIELGVPTAAKDNDGNEYMKYDFERPGPAPTAPGKLTEYIGFYSWEGAPQDLGVAVFIRDGQLVLDDFSLNTLYLIGPDSFYCDHDPWKVDFLRNQEGAVDSVVLHFLRRSVTVNKVR